MGIKDFLVIKYVDAEGKAHTFAELGREILWKDMRGKRIAIDAMNVIYASMLVAGSTFSLTDKEGRETKHVNTIMQKVLKYRKFGIEQIWVFDGPATALKDEEIARRNATRGSTVQVTPDQIAEIKELLTLAGINYMISAPGVEGEMFAAYLTKSTLEQPAFCDYVISNDADVLVVGGNAIMTKMRGQKLRPAAIGWNFNSDELRAAAGITQQQLIDAAVCLGSDFSAKIPGIGPATVIQRVKKDDVQWTEQSNAAREYFGNMDSPEFMGSDDNMPEFIRGALDKTALKAFLGARNFTVARFKIDEIL